MKNKNTRSLHDIIAISAAVLLILVFFFAFSTVTNHHLSDANAYNTYELQAKSWLEGRLDLDNREWLELATYGGKYYVSFPPLPSVILLPFVAVFGTGTDNYIAFTVLLLGVAFTYLLARKWGLSPLSSALMSCALYLGTNMRQITSDAWVWFFAQNLAFLFTTLCFFCASYGKKGLSMLFLACAVGCRPFQLIYLPIVLIILLSQIDGKNLSVKFKKLIFNKIWVYTPALLLVFFYCALNYARFGSIFEFGHNYLPEFLRSENGQFSLSYFVSNLPCLFRLPTFKSGTLFVTAFDGMSIFLVIPFFTVYPLSVLLSFVRDRKIENGVYHIVGSLLILLHIFLLLCHRTMGGAHFGNRYIMDTVPMLFFLSALSFKQIFSKKGNFGIILNAVCVLCFVFGIFLNFFGTALFYGSEFSFIAFG